MENQYKRVVPWEGNRAALKAMAEVFQLRPYFEWRGLGFISQSALRLRDEYAAVGRRAALPDSQHASDRSQGRAVRRSSQRRAETRAVQAVRQGMHAGTSNRRANGFFRGFMRSILQLRTSQNGSNGDAASLGGLNGNGGAESAPAARCAFATRRLRWRTALAARPAADSWKAFSLRSCLRTQSDLWATLPTSISAAAPIAITTDSFVVKPLRFPGGSIGELAVNGTMNDLAVSGAKGQRHGGDLRS